MGSYRANAFGLYDMHGNVSEWCAAWDDGKYYEASPTEDPTGPAGGWDRVARVARGGNHDSAFDCRAASRDRDEPSGRQGFRLARPVSSSP